MTVNEFDKLGQPFSDERRPPMNSACAPDIFNKLDAGTIERTRVVNSQLDVKLNVQERVLLKYQNAAKQRFVHERDRVKTDLRSISRRLPNYADVPKMESEIAKLRLRKRRRHDCVFTTEPVDFRFATGRRNKPYCDRYFTHHVLTNPRYYSYRPIGSGSSAPELRSRSGDMSDTFPVRPAISGGSETGTGLPVRSLLSRGSMNSAGLPMRSLISRGSMMSTGLPDIQHMEKRMTQSEHFGPPDVES